MRGISSMVVSDTACTTLNQQEGLVEALKVFGSLSGSSYLIYYGNLTKIPVDRMNYAKAMLSINSRGSTIGWGPQLMKER